MDNGNDLNYLFDTRAEREEFERLLSFQDRARLMSIREEGGWGKSHLLRVLAQRCRTAQPRIPVCLVALHQLEEKSEFGLVLEAYNQLLRYFPRSPHDSVPFPRFARLHNAIESGDSEQLESSQYLQQYFQEANFEGARGFNIANRQFNIDTKGGNVIVPGDDKERPKLTEHQLRAARMACVEAFFDDLQEICESRPVVLLFDTYDRCESALQQWIVTTLLERYVFDLDNRPSQLLIVLAGQRVPNYEGEWPSELIQDCVRVFPKMSQWQEEDIKQCLTTYGYPYKQHHVRTLLDMAEQGVPPKLIIHTMGFLFRRSAV